MVHTAELFQRDHTVIELLVLSHDDLLVVTFTDDQTRVTPTEVVHTPEGVYGQEETVNRVSKKKC